MADPLNLLSDLIARARAAGADAADAVLISGTSLSAARRLGKTEHVERSDGRDPVDNTGIIADVLTILGAL